MNASEIRRYAGDWCNVTYRDRGTDDDHTRIQMPREDQHDGMFRFTDRDIGVEFFIRYEDVVHIELIDGGRYSAASQPCGDCGEVHGADECPGVPDLTYYDAGGIHRGQGDDR